MKPLTILGILLFLFFQVKGQAGGQYEIAAIGFYNFENLFDTLDTPDVRDEEFTPSGDKLYNTRIYREKLDRLAGTVAEVGRERTPDGLAILGVAEVENRQVLEDFVGHPRLRDRDYRIVHYDSPDQRGIDVALLYQPKYFEPTASRAVPVPIREYGADRPTRDILLVSGNFRGDRLHVLVNHWPSRSGGESATEKYRALGARKCKMLMDSLCRNDPQARVILLGDLNDDPSSTSVRKILDAKRRPDQVGRCGCYNPMYDLYKKGFGTVAWRDAWSLFDQIIVNQALLRPDTGGYRYFQVGIHNPKKLVQQTGPYKGYPFRTYAGDRYLGGYSDHFPVYVYLVREIVEGK